jgi:4-hydroxy-tetrahydrodipicolinate reductase
VIRVGVLGAAGRMGRVVCRAVIEDPELELVAAINPSLAGDSLGDLIGIPSARHLRLSGELELLRDSAVEVAVDFTTPAAVMANVHWLIAHGIHAVVGTTGLGPDEIEEIRGWLREHEGRSSCLVAPNFSVGAVLMQRFAAEAAGLFPAAEIFELHHAGKLDAPSGTALATARRMAEARRERWEGPHEESVPGVRGGDVEGVRVHSVRLPGLMAHQEVLLGGPGQTLAIRHDAYDRVAFMPGVLMAVKAVGSLPGLTVGIDPLLGLDGPGRERERPA